MENLKTMMYSDIHTMPIFNWFMLSKNNDFNYLLKQYDDVCNEENISVFEERSNELTQQYLDLFGADGDTEMLMVHLKAKIRLSCDLLLTGNIFIKNQIKIVQDQIDSLIPEESKSTLESNLVRISKYVGYAVKSKETSVVEYKETMLMIDEDTKNAKKWQTNQ